MEGEIMDSMIRQFYEIPGKIVALKSGEYLFHEGDHAKYFYFVRRGQIFITKFAESGRVLSLRLATCGSIIGELPLYEENPVYIFNAVAQSDSEVYAIEFPTLHSWLEKKPSLAINLLKIIATFKVPRPCAVRQEGRDLFNADTICQQLRARSRRRDFNYGAADESRACKLFGDGTRELEQNAWRPAPTKYH